MKKMFQRRLALSLGMLIVAGSCAAQDQGQVPQGDGQAPEGFSAVQAMQVVDCLLPGQIRQVGGRPYPTPRRPTRTVASDCAARGGEFLVYDRANVGASLEVWLPEAQDGDPEAQTIVGELLEGAGDEPDYEAAALWYRRAAEQGYARAQFNLGTLYEQGLGVPRDRLESLNWYRRASGLSEDSVIFRSAAAAQQAELRSSLLEQIRDRDREIDALRRQIEAMNEQLTNRAEDAAEIRAQLSSFRAVLERLEADRLEQQQALERLPEPEESIAALGSFEEPEQEDYRRAEFGRFYALIIGVQEYERLDDLTSPANDIARIARVLEERYGFSVLTLADPDRESLMRAVNRLNDTLDENDNLLIYFSGHGSRLPIGVREAGYWLPRNADPAPDDTFWVSNDFVSRHLGMIEARRVLVIADSCFAGLLGEEPGYALVGERGYTDEYIEWKRPKRSRLVLSSGGDRPVVEDPTQDHSVFARALLEELEANEQVLTAPELFLRVRRRVRASEASVALRQEPELKAVKDAGHEVGDFFFIPARG